MKELKILQDMGYKFWIDGCEIRYKNTFVNQGGENVRKYLMELKKHKGTVRYLLEQGLDNDDPEIVAVDIETYMEKIIIVSWHDRNGSYVTKDVEEIRELLEDNKIRKVFHNAQFDVTILEKCGCKVSNYFDTMVMSQIIHNRSRSENSLKDCAMEFLGIDMDKSFQDENNWNGEITQDHLEYCKKDSEITYRLYTLLRDKIEELYLEEVMYREMFALPTVIELSKTGIGFDFESWSEELGMIDEEKNAVEQSIKEFFNDDTLNINSPEQLKNALRGNGIDITSTADDVLAKKEGKYPIITTIRKYKKLKSILTRYGDNLKDALVDGRVFSKWRIIGANTGRMTCNDINVQGFPKRAKRYFKPVNGYKFVVADYSQIELRVLAEISGDTTMIDCIRNGIDLHKKTAASIFNKDIEDITDDERKIAKTINFGIVYGMSAYGIQNRIKATCNIDISIKKAEEFRNAYFALYPDILKFQDEMLKSNCIKTLGGRYWSKETGELKLGSIQRFNYPIQATAAEGFKEALKILMDRKQADWNIVAVVHDEIVLEVPESEVDDAINVLRNTMIDGMQKLIKNVPIAVDVNSGDYWVK